MDMSAMNAALEGMAPAEVALGAGLMAVAFNGFSGLI